MLLCIGPYMIRSPSDRYSYQPPRPGKSSFYGMGPTAQPKSEADQILEWPQNNRIGAFCVIPSQRGGHPPSKLSIFLSMTAWHPPNDQTFHCRYWSRGVGLLCVACLSIASSNGKVSEPPAHTPLLATRLRLCIGAEIPKIRRSIAIGAYMVLAGRLAVVMWKDDLLVYSKDTTISLEPGNHPEWCVVTYPMYVLLQPPSSTKILHPSISPQQRRKEKWRKVKRSKARKQTKLNSQRSWE